MQVLIHKLLSVLVLLLLAFTISAQAEGVDTTSSEYQTGYKISFSDNFGGKCFRGKKYDQRE